MVSHHSRCASVACILVLICRQLSIAVVTNKSKIGARIVGVVTVNVIHYHRYGLTHPFGNAAHFTDVTNLFQHASTGCSL